jgi:hypothetical protein
MNTVATHQELELTDEQLQTIFGAGDDEGKEDDEDPHGFDFDSRGKHNQPIFIYNRNDNTNTARSHSSSRSHSTVDNDIHLLQALLDLF